jgi:two-component system OmpR family sensor kinase
VRWQRITLALLPVSVGLMLAALVLGIAAIPNPILYARLDLGNLVWVAGLVLSLLAGAGVAIWEVQEGACQRHIAETLMQAANERRRFLQRLDHELKNPLMAIRAGLTNLTNGSTEASRGEALRSVETQVLRLSQLTGDLRKLAELEARPLERAPVNIAELLHEAVALGQEQPEAAPRHLTLTLPLAPWPVPDIAGDWDLLFLATYNLVDNALKFTQPGDTVEVRASDDRSHVTIEVADTGPGIPEDELPYVWKELYRGKGARGIPGSGLGLALVRVIVERHGGQVTLRSRSGQGTVVSMRLPTT